MVQLRQDGFGPSPAVIPAALPRGVGGKPRLQLDKAALDIPGLSAVTTGTIASITWG